MEISQLEKTLLTICKNKNIPYENIIRAIECAKNAHQGQMRKSGEPYITHPLEVAILVADLDGSESMIIAAILHDTIEDTSISKEYIAKHYGKEICNLVLGCTKTSAVRVSGNEEELEKERLRNLFVALSSDPRVIVIKLADRLHNLRTIKALPEEKAKRIAVETLAIHSPLAHRLGLGSIKAELEDRSFEIADPDNYHKILDKINAMNDLHQVLAQASEELTEHLNKLSIKAEVHGRIKHNWSVFKKIQEYSLDLPELHDLLGLRVIVDKESDCYDALESLTLLWEVDNTRVKDYIKNPKENGYRSIHATSQIARGRKVEVQIRTKEMHREAEFGPASHWSYKNRAEKDAPWLKRLLDWEHQSESVSEYLEAVKRELNFRKDILVLTPGKDVHNLPEGSTVIDLAYAVHTKVGESAVGALINGERASLESVLQSGDTVEIIKGKRSGPSLDWLNFCITSKAKSSIRKYHQRKRRLELLTKGELILEKLVKSEGIVDENLHQHLSLKSKESLLEKLALGSITDLQIRKVLHKQKKLESLTKNITTRYRKDSSYTPAVLGVNLELVAVSKCCAPNPGDPIVAIPYTGIIKVHNKNCQQIPTISERSLEAYWVKKGYHLEKLTLKVDNRFGILAEIASRIHAVGGELKRADFNNGYLILILEITLEQRGLIKMALKLSSGVDAVEFNK